MTVDIEFEIDDLGFTDTECPFGREFLETRVLVGSVECEECPFFVRADHNDMIVTCSGVGKSRRIINYD